MQWSITLGRVAGIDVRLHLTFLLLLVWIGLAHFLRGGVSAAIEGLLFLTAIFGSVLIHEFGHALTARRFGIRTPDITLFPIGGVARLERMPDEPRQELIVALAGPATNVVIALLLYLVIVASGAPAALSVDLIGGSLPGRVLFVNLWLVLFNLIPAFPMDGGRVLRALLAERMDFARATRIAASVGQAFAFAFALVGFFVNPLLIFIALFVYLGAAGEVPVAELREFTRGVPVQSVMVTRFQTLREDARLAQAVSALLEGTQTDFPVVDEDGRLAGILCREDMIRGLSEEGPGARVGAVMQADVPHAAETEMLQSAFQRMAVGKHAAIPVVDASGGVVGLLTRENVGELMMVQSAMSRLQRLPKEPQLV